METDKLIEGAEIVRFIRHKELNGWDIYSEWTKQE
jgi:hypothetical protein